MVVLGEVFRLLTLRLIGLILPVPLDTGPKMSHPPHLVVLTGATKVQHFRLKPKINRIIRAALIG